MSMNENMFENKEDFLKRINDMRDLLTDMKANIRGLMELKSKSTTDTLPLKSPQISDALNSNLVDILDFRAKHRDMQIELENIKSVIQKEKEKVDEKNISLESFLYEKNHLLNEIESCKSFQTANLDKLAHIVDKANPHSLEERDHDKFLELLTEEHTSRKELDKEYNSLVSEKHSREEKVSKLTEICTDLPAQLSKIEDSSQGLRELLLSPGSLIQKPAEGSELLPAPLYNLYWKFIQFSHQYSNQSQMHMQEEDKFCGDANIEIEIVGDKSERVIEAFYKEHEKCGRMMFNKEMELRCMSGAHQESKIKTHVKDKEKSSLLDSNKKIKKKSKKKTTKGRVIEEPVINTVDVFLKQSDQTQIKTLKKLHKFPLALKIVIHKFPLPDKLPCFKVLKEKKVDTQGVFPIVLVFSLLPQINLVLCSCTSTKKEFGSIQLLSDLFIHDNAQHSIENLKRYHLEWNREEEKGYSWVQFLSSFNDFAFMSEEQEKQFKTSPQNLQTSTSTKDKMIIQQKFEYLYNPNKITISLLMRKLKDRGISLSFLNYQLEFLTKNKKICSEILGEMRTEGEFKFMKEKCQLKELNIISQEELISGIKYGGEGVKMTDEYDGNGFEGGNQDCSLYESYFTKNQEGVYVKRYRAINTLCKYQHAIYLYIHITHSTNYSILAYVQIPYDYPIRPPSFKLVLQSIKSKEEFNSEHKFIIDKVNQKDLNQIQSLQIQNFGYSDILEEIETELCEHYDEFCPFHMRNFLLSYQIKKLQICIHIWVESENKKSSNFFKKGNKGMFRSFPFKYNSNTNTFEQRK